MPDVAKLLPRGAVTQSPPHLCQHFLLQSNQRHGANQMNVTLHLVYCLSDFFTMLLFIALCPFLYQFFSCLQVTFTYFILIICFSCAEICGFSSNQCIIYQLLITLLMQSNLLIFALWFVIFVSQLLPQSHKENVHFFKRKTVSLSFKFK